VTMTTTSAMQPKIHFQHYRHGLCLCLEALEPLPVHPMRILS
jgi:hypothetical protein